LGGQLSTALGRRIDPNESLDMKDPKVRQVLADYRRSGVAQQQDSAAPPSQQPTIISPPSASRTATAVVAPPRNSGGVVAPQSAPAQPQTTYGGEPSAWLMTTAKNRALDVLRRERTARTFAPELARLLDSEWTLALSWKSFLRTAPSKMTCYA
jgi:hypothetical protein